MVEVRLGGGWLHLLLLLQAAAAETSQLVGEGGRAVLTCGHLTGHTATCESVTWIFSDAVTGATKELVTLGSVRKNQQLTVSLREDCALLIPEVRVEYAGRYCCLKYRSGVRQLPDESLYLSVVTLRDVRNVDEVRLICCVATDTCSHQVRWLFNKMPLAESPIVKISQSSCKATLKTLTSGAVWRNKEILSCEVRSEQTVETFPFGASGRAAATAAASTPSPRTAEAWPTLRDFWWLFVVFAAVLVAALTVVMVVKRKRAKGADLARTGLSHPPKGQTTGSAVTRSSPEVGPDTVDAEDPVSYAAIIIKSRGKAQGQRHGGDNRGDGVIYTTVKAPQH